MKKQIIIELDQKDNYYRLTISTPHYQRFDLYYEQNTDLDNLLDIVASDITPRFLKDYFQDLGFSLDEDKLEEYKQNNEKITTKPV